MSNTALVPAERQVLVTYAEDTPPSILQEAKDAVVAAGGKIMQEYSLIKGFAATVSNEIIDTITTLSNSHRPVVEEDGLVMTKQQEPLER